MISKEQKSFRNERYGDNNSVKAEVAARRMNELFGSTGLPNSDIIASSSQNSLNEDRQLVDAQESQNKKQTKTLDSAVSTQIAVMALTNLPPSGPAGSTSFNS